MKRFGWTFIMVLTCALMQAQTGAQTRYVGGDISMLPMYEQHNSAYKDAYNHTISDMISWLINDCGWNTFRVRIFVNPQRKNAKGETDPQVCQDLQYVTALGQRIKAAGAYFMLDFHYSDTWVDALNIQAPEAWKNCTAAEKADSVGRYTREVLTALNAAGATPDLVQVGNEIMYGLCGIKVAPYSQASTDANWPDYLNLLRAGTNAVREVCPQAQIIIHTDRPCNKSYDFYYYNKLRTNDVDYDIIGLSYYPFWHADFTPTSANTGADVLAPLVSAINYLKTQFPEKRVQIVECAYNFQYWPTKGVNYNTQAVWPCSKAGQYNFVKDLVDNLKPLENLDGINYWFPEEAGNGDDTYWQTSSGTVLTGWLNRGFWDENISTSGHAINRTISGYASQSVKPETICAPYYMRHFLNEDPQGIEETKAAPQSEKQMVNGRLLIRVGDKQYNALGQEER